LDGGFVVVAAEALKRDDRRRRGHATGPAHWQALVVANT